ncbi:helix-turn-helix domain-containing protein [Collimonas silvisoli]|uniref:helix-turn-helix domain-containing protein n=1 Tax=Collimonas silvisoli TaxID=2825884 RepID=UPI001B8B949D|nr:helix-turn-helix transcriptional regulator [Collimonas silvisoli]
MEKKRNPSPGKERHPVLIAFGEVVRRRRKVQGFSQEAFGDACGIDRSYMGGIERGEHNLSLINIMKIIDTLGLQPSEFFSGLDGRNPFGIMETAIERSEQVANEEHGGNDPSENPHSP